MLLLYFAAWHQPVQPWMSDSPKSTKLQQIGFFASSNPAVAGKRVSFFCNVKKYNPLEDKVDITFKPKNNPQFTTKIVSDGSISDKIKDTEKFKLYREEDMFVLTIRVNSSHRDAGLYTCVVSNRDETQVVDLDVCEGVSPPSCFIPSNTSCVSGGDLEIPRCSRPYGSMESFICGTDNNLASANISWNEKDTENGKSIRPIEGSFIRDQTQNLASGIRANYTFHTNTFLECSIDVQHCGGPISCLIAITLTEPIVDSIEQPKANYLLPLVICLPVSMIILLVLCFIIYEVKKKRQETGTDVNPTRRNNNSNNLHSLEPENPVIIAQLQNNENYDHSTINVAVGTNAMRDNESNQESVGVPEEEDNGNESIYVIETLKKKDTKHPYVNVVEGGYVNAIMFSDGYAQNPLPEYVELD